MMTTNGEPIQSYTLLLSEGDMDKLAELADETYTEIHEELNDPDTDESEKDPLRVELAQWERICKALSDTGPNQPQSEQPNQPQP